MQTESSKRVALVGNPNCGKTTLFNGLTGAKQRVANFPGVTVDVKMGACQVAEMSLELYDLPGIYSLITHTDAGAEDERIASEFITHESIDLLINVVDAANLERNLYLTAQLLEMQLPMVVVLNMLDVAERRQWHINVADLSRRLDCPVIPMCAHRGDGMVALHASLKEALSQRRIPASHANYPPIIIECLANLRENLPPETKPFTLLRLLEDDPVAKAAIAEHHAHSVAALQARLCRDCQDDPDTLIADARYEFVHTITSHVLTQRTHKPSHTQRIDNIVLHRWLGIPLFFLMMYAVFVVALNFGGVFQDFFDIATHTLFVEAPARLLLSLHAPHWLIAITAYGAGKGINTTFTFIPVISMMFFVLAFLEASGYMARAAFVMDRLLRFLGLPGRAFVPLLIGFGCNVPAIMATRTLPTFRDRVMTGMMAPFMSCGARLALFAVFTAAFFPQGGQNIIFSLYVIGILLAIVTGLLLRLTVLPGETTPLVLELPAYHLPTFTALLWQTGNRLQQFLVKAGWVIVPVCVLLGLLNSISSHGELVTDATAQQSLLAIIGQALTPIFAPMGITQDNWPATVGLLTGSLAKEVVMGTLNSLYTQMGHLQAATTSLTPSLSAGLVSAFSSIVDNLVALPHYMLNPLAGSVPEYSLTPGLYRIMVARFHNPQAAYAYLLFLLLYLPCVSTMAVMHKEYQRGWMLFSLIWSTSLAYFVATVYYQITQFGLLAEAPWLWFLTMLICAIGLLFGMQKYLARHRPAGALL